MAIELTGRRVRPLATSPIVMALVLFAALAFLTLAGLSLVLAPGQGWIAYAEAATLGLGFAGLVWDSWRRLTVRGRWLVAAPLGLAACSFALRGLGLAGADLAGYAAFAAFLAFVALVGVGRFGFVRWFAAAGAFVRRSAPSEEVTLSLDDGALSLRTPDGEELERWPVADLAAASLAGAVLALRDKIGDELEVEIDPDNCDEVRGWLDRVSGAGRGSPRRT